MRLFPLVAATYFIVSGGPYGTEDIIGKAGYGFGLLLLAVVPLLWSMPTALMVGELASAIPEEGGFYVWVTRALGRFWGFQEAWLSLASSVFDMAIYPTTFVLYLSQVAPGVTAGHRGLFIELSIVAIAAVWNLRGAASVGHGSSGMMFISLSPFVVLVGAAWWRALHGGLHLGAQVLPMRDLGGAVPIVLWNYMGWDNASTIAQEVDDPQRNYPRAMFAAVLVVMLVYMIPLLSMWAVGLPPDRFSAGTGTWADTAKLLAGSWLALGVVLAGSIDGVGTFTALTLTLTRLPSAMAADGFLPSVLQRENKRGVPWVSVLVCATCWALALGPSFERLISIDLVLYGGALVLEFLALIVLRYREPELPRPFRVPGGKAGTVLLGIGPTLLISTLR